jgi:hypothetical protein
LLSFFGKVVNGEWLVVMQAFAVRINWIRYYWKLVYKGF